MTIQAFLDVLDPDTQIMVEYNYDTIFYGMRDEAIQHIEKFHQMLTIKAIWYSKLNNAIVLEI